MSRTYFFPWGALVAFFLRCNEAREQILNISSAPGMSKERSPAPDEAASGEARKRRAAAAAHRRQKIMAQMNAQASKFAREHASDLESVDADSATPTPSSAGSFDPRSGFPFPSSDSTASSSSSTSPSSTPVAAGPRRTPAAVVDGSRCYTCILCQADQVLLPSGDPAQDALVTPAHIQNSTVLSQTIGGAAAASPCRF